VSESDEEFLKKLRAAFKVEAEEHVQAIASGLLELEQAIDATRSQEVVASVFRQAHSLKGAARAVGAARIETICQGMEGVFAAWRKTGISPSADLLDPLHQAVNVVAECLAILHGGGAEPDEKTSTQLMERLTELESAARSVKSPKTAAPAAEAVKESPVVTVVGEEAAGAASPLITSAGAPAAAIAPGAGRPASFETIRIATAKLDALLLQTEEMLSLKLIANQRAAEVKGLRDLFSEWDKRWMRFSLELRTPGTAAGMAEFFEWSQMHLRGIEEKLTALLSATDHDRRSVGALVDTLLEDSKKLLMLPFSTLFESFPKLVRDLSRDQGKEVDLAISGADVQIDKRILEEMKDPLVHLLRNGVDHGIEPPQKRVMANKLPRGSIGLAISQEEGNKVEILISDDGDGIDTAEVRRAAVKQGLLGDGEGGQLSEDEAIALAFRPEISTSPIVTSISGRGLGLAIVKEKVQRLGGRIEVQTRKGLGTSFRIKLPLTLATFRGILVESAGQQFVLPVANVDRVSRVSPGDIQSVENRQTVLLDDRPVSLVRLEEVLNLPKSPPIGAGAYIPVVVLSAGGERIAFAVSEIVGEQEVLVKRLAEPLVRVRNVAGATVLGSGKAVVILNASDLMKSAADLAAGPGTKFEQAESEKGPRSILVVEDSITARMLLKNIFESAGYRVKTAVDGLEGLTTLRSEGFDLVVSDVEMPRMNGFELTAKIRADKKLAEVPVVLVTALATPEDRAKGIDVGANAYVVKSSFDQSDLLQIVGRLL
jgi:two-component system chemotaxis sensor kinase CheA